jgi:hypothetical protein
MVMRTIEEMEAELARQDAELERFETAVCALGDVELAVPTAVLQELDELTLSRTTNPTMPVFGIRA